MHHPAQVVYCFNTIDKVLINKKDADKILKRSSVLCFDTPRIQSYYSLDPVAVMMAIKKHQPHVKIMYVIDGLLLIVGWIAQFESFVTGQ